MTQTLCQICDYPLDQRGRCARCFNADLESLEALKWQSVAWSVCKEHGAFEESRDRLFRRSWNECDPKDKRRKINHHIWTWRCPKCKDWFASEHAMPYREKILKRPELYAEELEARLKAWNA